MLMECFSTLREMCRGWLASQVSPPFHALPELIWMVSQKHFSARACICGCMAPVGLPLTAPLIAKLQTEAACAHETENQSNLRIVPQVHCTFNAFRRMHGTVLIQLTECLDPFRLRSFALCIAGSAAAPVCLLACRGSVVIRRTLTPTPEMSI